MLQVSASKETLKVIVWISLLGMLVLLLLAGLQLWKTKDYVPVEATLEEILRERSTGNSDSRRSSVIKRYYYSYQLEGQTHSYKTRSFLGFFRRVGSTTTLYVAPGTADLVRDTFQLECCLLGAAFLGIFLWFSLSAMKVKN